MFREARFVIDPPTCCPPSLRVPGPAGFVPPPQITFDMYQVGLAALHEMTDLQGRLNPIFLLFSELLVARSRELRWRDGGFGKGREVRRGLSNLFGRFFARAFLERHMGYTWFAPVDGAASQITYNLTVERTTPLGDMPDWFCMKPGEAALAEAKGSYAHGIVAANPGPIVKAQEQLDRAAVYHVARARKEEKHVKRWAIMSRWASERHNVDDAVFYVADPDRPAREFSEEEMDDALFETSRRHLARIASSLRLSELASHLDRPTRHPMVFRTKPDLGSYKAAIVQREGMDDRRFIGVVIGMHGVIGEDIDTVVSDVRSMPSYLRQNFMFFGIDAGVLESALSDNTELDLPDVVSKFQHMSEDEARQRGEVFYGRDGTLLCNAEYIDGTESISIA